MGLLGIFSKGPLSEQKINKIAKLAANPFAQPDVRMREMQRLLADGSTAALRGVLKRFASNASGHIADEDEKKWLEDQLVEVGEPALAPLADYISTAEQLSYAVHAYRRIAGTDATIDFILSILNRYGPDDYRSSEAKQQLILELTQDHSNPRVIAALIPFLRDHSDEVRWAVLDVLESAAREGLLDASTLRMATTHLGEIILTDDNRPRIEQRAALLLSTYEWPIAGDKSTLPPLLDEEYFIDKKRFVRRRAKRLESGRA